MSTPGEFEGVKLTDIVSASGYDDISVFLGLDRRHDNQFSTFSESWAQLGRAGYSPVSRIPQRPV